MDARTHDPRARTGDARSGSAWGLAANEGKRYWKLKTERDGELQIENNFDHGDKKLYQEKRER